MKHVFLTLFALLFSGAAMAKGGGLVGMAIDDVIENAGYPDDSFTAPNGRTVYVWGESHTVQSMPFTGHYGHYHRSEITIPSQTITSWCKVYMEVDAEDRVIAVRTKGNSCP